MDVVLRATIVFLILGLVMRITGKRQIAQLSAFDLILIVTMGDLVGQTVLQEDYSLTAGTLAVLTFGVLSMLMGLAMYFMPKSRPLLRGHATILVHDGDLDHEVLKNEMIHIHDLNEAARQAGIRDLRDVELAIMETDGTFSFFTRRGSSDDDQPDSSERGPEKTR